MNFLLTHRKTLLGAAVAAILLPSTALAEEQSNLHEVVITSSRIEVPLERVASSISVITADEIEARGHATLADILRSDVGISVTSSGGMGKQTSLRVRGEDGYRTLILVDGVDIADPSGTQAQAHIEHILASDVERIEILRGPQGMIYGADAGGVINIITKSATDGFSGGFNAEQGRYGTTRLNGSLRGKTDRFDYSVDLADIESDGFNARSNDPTADQDGYENTTVGLKAGFAASDALRFELQVRDLDSQAEYDGCGFPTSFDCSNTYDQTNYKGTASYKADGNQHQLSYAFTDTERGFYTNGAFSFVYTGEMEQLQYLGSQSFGDNTLIFGADWDSDSIEGTFATPSDRDQLGIYVEWQGAVGEQFFYTAGVRHDDNDDFGTHNSVRLSSAYLVDVAGNPLKLKANYSTGFRAPSLSEIAYNTGPWAFGAAAATDLDAETSKGWDAGFEYSTEQGAVVEVIYFEQELEDEIFFDLATFSGYLQEDGQSQSKGVEISAEYPLAESLLLTANYTYIDSQKFDGAPRYRVPQETYNAGIRYAGMDDKLRISASMRWVVDVVDINRVLDDYHVLDVSASYQATEWANVYLRAENALDETYQEVDTYNASRAAIYGGVRISF